MTTSLAKEYAIRAWTRRQSGKWTAADEEELQAWLRASSEHHMAYDEVAKVWEETAALAGRFPRDEAPHKNSRRLPLLAACAAAVVAIAAVPLWKASARWWNGEPQHWSTDHNKPSDFVLADGTRVTLDAGSELFATIGHHARRVTLERGEAVFAVTHDASRPFELRMGPGKVVDVGTRFDAEVLPDVTHVTVLEGRVAISTTHGNLLLDVGQASGYDKQGRLLPITASDSAVTLWAGGKRRFNSETLSDVLERLARYHQVSFVFTDPNLEKLRVSGTFRVDDLPLFLRTLSAALPIATQQTGTRVEVRPR